MKTKEQLREQFEKETGGQWFFNVRDYATWLEPRLLSQSRLAAEGEKLREQYLKGKLEVLNQYSERIGLDVVWDKQLIYEQLERNALSPQVEPEVSGEQRKEVEKEIDLSSAVKDDSGTSYKTFPTPSPGTSEGEENPVLEHHGKPCFICHEPISELSGNPGRWPIQTTFDDGTGIVRLVHRSCVTITPAPPIEKEGGEGRQAIMNVLRSKIKFSWEHEEAENGMVPTQDAIDAILEYSRSKPVVKGEIKWPEPITVDGINEDTEGYKRGWNECVAKFKSLSTPIIIETLRVVLKPEFKNTVYTWAQIEKALKNNERL